MLLALIACLNPWVIDGDSLRCGQRATVGEGGRAARGYVGEVRLLGIDAPDFRDSRPCRLHFGDHVCDDAGDRAATRSLIALVAPRRGTVRLLPIARDRYGRLVAEAWAGSTDLSCWQIQRHVARYIVAYDNGRRIARACRR